MLCLSRRAPMAGLLRSTDCHVPYVGLPRATPRDPHTAKNWSEITAQFRGDIGQSDASWANALFDTSLGACRDLRPTACALWPGAGAARPVGRAAPRRPRNRCLGAGAAPRARRRRPPPRALTSRCRRRRGAAAGSGWRVPALRRARARGDLLPLAPRRPHALRLGRGLAHQGLRAGLADGELVAAHARHRGWRRPPRRRSRRTRLGLLRGVCLYRRPLQGPLPSTEGSELWSPPVRGPAVHSSPLELWILAWPAEAAKCGRRGRAPV